MGTYVHQTPATPATALFAPGMLGRTFVAALTAIAVNAGLYGFVAWLPTFFVKEGLSITQSLSYVFLVSFGAPAGAVVGYFVADRVGRRNGLVLFSFMSIVPGFAYVQMRDPAAISAMGFALVTSLYTVCTLGLFGYIPELFPTTHRLRGTGVAGICGRGASMCTPLLAVLLYTQFGVSGVVAMVACVLACLCVALLLLQVETGGLALEVISSDAQHHIESVRQSDASAWPFQVSAVAPASSASVSRRGR
jgi:MFS transporter, putative metabolite:H+ symporter